MHAGFLLILCGVLAGVESFRGASAPRVGTKLSTFADTESGLLEKVRVLGPLPVLNHIGDYTHEGDYSNSEYSLNVGKALDTLRRELPMVFYTSDLDFSIFNQQITVIDFRGNKVKVQKQIYTAGMKSLKMASTFSTMHPSMNVRKIEYLDASRSIQCLVDVVLPDSVRIEGRAAWEGMFYFGLNDLGLIDTHIFDSKITNFSSSSKKAHQYPWLRSTPAWSADLIRAPAPVPNYAYDGGAIVESASQ
mmetsp:Transcript_9743/g.21665  ORF Transcript_9743/g.21665 Transcript_9743/m.21665 type:complete len:248 (-) Transcript_9743:636-1379(-)